MPNTTILLAIDFATTISEEPLNSVCQLIRVPLVVIHRIMVFKVELVEDVDSIETVVNEVTNYSFSPIRLKAEPS